MMFEFDPHDQINGPVAASALCANAAVAAHQNNPGWVDYFH